MIVIADTTLFNYLLQAELVHCLPSLFGEVLIPKAVLGELEAEGAPDVVRSWASRLPKWLRVVELPSYARMQFSRLDPGESEAISLALMLSADLILIDDLRGRRAARLKGLAVVGTFGVLRDAADE
jgi:predicted nucleic acid-binding protein